MELLDVAVNALGGSRRKQQDEMVAAVWQAIRTDEHLAVQAGTGTGKSLAYLVAAIAAAVSGFGPVVVSTATKALQNQIVNRDLPELIDALAAAGKLPRRPSFALLKGRNNYLCVEKFDRRATKADTNGDYRQVRRWASETTTGNRDDLKPGVVDAVWAEFSVSGSECPTAANCPAGDRCFAERARERAGEVDIVVANHALLAINAATAATALPDHAVLVVDEAHDLAKDVTKACTSDLSESSLNSVMRLVEQLPTAGEFQRFRQAAAAFAQQIPDVPFDKKTGGLVDYLDKNTESGLDALRRASAAALLYIKASPPPDPAQRYRATSAISTVHDTVGRILTSFDPRVPLHERADVVWIHREKDKRLPPTMKIAPMSVAPILREHVFAAVTTILTSATLTVDGSFDAVVQKWGLDGVSGWKTLDVGTPFDYARSGVLYCARQLPPSDLRKPDGLPARFDEMAAFITAAGGRTLGLFASYDTLELAVAEVRDRLSGMSLPVLRQGEDGRDLDDLISEFANNPEVSLFGVHSLWQGVDVRGPSLSVVLIDKIPFDRPDTPLVCARQRAIESLGRDGFMEESVNRAAVLLDQGAGRLLRSVDDKGVVAVLDHRMVTTRYGSYLRASLPPLTFADEPKGPLDWLRTIPR